MRSCSFPGCERFPHSHGISHAIWDADAASWVPLSEQRTPVEQMRDRRDKLNREKAGQIADQVMENMTGTESLREIASLAALAALAEKERTR